MIKKIYCSAALLAAFNLTYAAMVNVTAKKVSGYEAYSEGRQINVYRFVGQYGGNYFAYVSDKPTIERRCSVVNGKCKGEPTGRAALRAQINEGFCQRPNWSALTCYSGVGGSDESRGDGSGTPDNRGNDGSRTPAGSGGQGSGRDSTNTNGGSDSGSGGTNTNGGSDSGSGSAGNGGGSQAPKHRKGSVFYYILSGNTGYGTENFERVEGYTTTYCNQLFNGGVKQSTLSKYGINHTIKDKHNGKSTSYTLYCTYVNGGEKDIYDHTDSDDQECQSTKYVKADTGKGSFSVLCTKKPAPTNDSSPSVESLGGNDSGDGGGPSDGSGSGGGKPSNSGSQGGGDSGGSSDSSDASTGGSSEGEGRDYSAILESIFDKLTDVVDAVKDATSKILAKMGRGDAKAQSEGHGAQSGGVTATNDGQDGGTGGKGSNQGSGKVKGKDVQGDGEGDGQEDKDQPDRKDGEDKHQDGQDGDVEKPANDFGGEPTVDVGGALSGGGWFSDSASTVCPAPIIADLGFIGTFEISYEWLCAVARILRPFLVAFAYLAALLIVVRKGE